MLVAGHDSFDLPEACLKKRSPGISWVHTRRVGTETSTRPEGYLVRFPSPRMPLPLQDWPADPITGPHFAGSVRLSNRHFRLRKKNTNLN